MKIKNIHGEIIYSCDCETIKETVEKAVKEGISLAYADLRDVDLTEADLRDANLSNANLECADIRHANLSFTILTNAKLSGANLEHVCLYGARNVPNIPTDIPSEGELVGWKKVEDKIIKLQILEDSKRTQGTTDKCRCDKALVLEIQNLDGTKADATEITNNRFTPITYKVGEVVYADWWDDNRWYECSHGIHFFVSRQRAVKY